MLDSNLAPDHAKLAYVASLPQGEATILNIVDENAPPAIAELEDRFGVEQMLATSNTEAFMLSLLYYLGVLNLADTVTPDGKLILRIPNLVMERLYAHRLREMLLPDAGVRDEGQRAAEALYGQGKMEPLADFIEQRIFPIFDNRDYLQANELTIKTAFLILLFKEKPVNPNSLGLGYKGLPLYSAALQCNVSFSSNKLQFKWITGFAYFV